MKFFIVFLLLLPSKFLMVQEMQFTISANNKSIAISPDDNIDTVFTLNKNEFIKNGFLTVHVSNDEIEKDWKRSFVIYDNSDNVVLTFIQMKDKNFCITLNDLEKKLAPGQEYYVYTTAIPEDPKKAMSVRVARIPVCKLKIL
jgi:hypothetical protein